MRERLMTLALALMALLLFLTLFVHGQRPESRSVSLPTTVDRADDGLSAAFSWLSQEGVRVRPVRERFTALERWHDLPASGNLLIINLPAAVTFRNNEAVALDRWIHAGNTLLVLAALSDRPSWARDGALLDNDLHLLTGLEILPGRHPRGHQKPTARASREAHGESADETPAQTLYEAMRPLDKPQRNALIPNHVHRYLDGVQAAAGFSDFAPLNWKVPLPRDAFPLCLAHRDTSPECVLWLQAVGSGAIVVSGFGSLLSNRALAVPDNARLLANLVRSTVADDGVVLFDDQHQGLSDVYDPDKFYRDRRLYVTLAILAAVWLVWVVGGTRLVMPPAPPPAQGEEDLVRVTGSFLARVLKPSAAARRMFEHFFMRLQRTLRGPGDDPTPYWDWLENHPRLKRSEIAQLREWYADAHSERRVPLARLHNLIIKTERQIAA